MEYLDFFTLKNNIMFGEMFRIRTKCESKTGINSVILHPIFMDVWMRTGYAEKYTVDQIDEVSTSLRNNYIDTFRIYYKTEMYRFILGLDENVVNDENKLSGFMLGISRFYGKENKEHNIIFKNLFLLRVITHIGWGEKQCVYNLLDYIEEIDKNNVLNTLPAICTYFKNLFRENDYEKVDEFIKLFSKINGLFVTFSLNEINKEYRFSKSCFFEYFEQGYTNLITFITRFYENHNSEELWNRSVFEIKYDEELIEYQINGYFNAAVSLRIIKVFFSKERPDNLMKIVTNSSMIKNIILYKTHGQEHDFLLFSMKNTNNFRKILKCGFYQKNKTNPDVIYSITNIYGFYTGANSSEIMELVAQEYKIEKEQLKQLMEVKQKKKRAYLITNPKDITCVK